MSEMETEAAPSPDRLHEAIIEFAACVGNAVEDICSYGYTIGQTYVPFNPDPEEDCDEDDIQCSQLWVRTTSVTPTTAEPGFSGQDCATTLRMGLEVGILRCIEVPEDGEAPTATDVLVAGLQAMTDMNTILCAALSCEAWDGLTIGSWSPTGPLGGQYGGIWTFTVEL